MKTKLFNCIFLSFLILAPMHSRAETEVPVEADSRIKTVVYNENEVFTFITRHGFQSSIEFSADETIETISIGDAIGWQVTPAGRRIFIKPLQRNGITNLSVITNKHPYQFELVATDSSGRYSNHAYVLKFFYPDASGMSYDLSQDRTRGSTRPVSQTPIPELPTPPMSAPAPTESLTLPGEGQAVPLPASIPQMDEGLNFNYSLTGPDNIAPTKIYDDGKSTFFEVPATASANQLVFALVSVDGSESPVSARQQGNLMIVDKIGTKMTIRSGTDLICVYNEKLMTSNPMAR